MRGLILLLLLAGSALGGPDALRTYRIESRRLAAEDARFWREVTGRIKESFDNYRAEYDLALAQPTRHKEATFGYEGFRRLFADYARIQEAMGEVDSALAASGHRKALPALLHELFSVAREIDELEAELDKAVPRMRRIVFDQRPGIRNHGLAVRLRLLVQALARCPGAGDFLAGEGLERARKSDGRRSILRRVAVLDSMALAGGDAAREALTATLHERGSSLRIAALEGLMGYGAATRPALAPFLNDPSPIVRRALLQEISARGAQDPGWIEPVLEAFRVADGLARTDCLRALEVLTRQRFGYAPARWKEWFDEYRKEIEGGKFDSGKIEVEQGEPAAVKEAVSFYGIRTLSKGLFFVLDASDLLFVPADWEVQRTQWRKIWPGIRHNWEGTHPSHHAVLVREFDRALRTAPAGARFGAVSLFGKFATKTLGEKKLLRPRGRDLKAARAFVGKLVGSGWCSPLEGISVAARAGGKEPRIDTIFLVHVGDPRGGRYLSPEAVVEAFKRFNRFRRLVVHTIRIANEKEPAELLMRGLAEASGGTYLWARKPPR